MAVRALTVRLDEDTAADLEVAAQVEEMPVSDAIRAAVNEYLDSRRKDATFQTKVVQAIERNQAILARLAQR